MSGIHDLTLFIVSGLLLNLMPGPDTLLIMTRSATQGWRAGSAAALGIGTGVMLHVLAAAIGLSALLATSATAFSIVKWGGAAYIIYVGIGLLRKKNGPSAASTGMPATSIPPTASAQPALSTRPAGSAQPAPPTASAQPALSYRKIFFQGFLTNLLNPKVAIFFLAFVPQFISADAPSKAFAFIILGAVFDFNSMLWCHFLAISTAFASRRLKPAPIVVAWLNRVTGGLFIALGVKLALSRQS